MDLKALIYGFSVLLYAFSYVFILYHFAVSIFAWIPRKAKGFDNSKINTFALIIAAHNEQSVITNMVESLKKLNYPKECYDIFVIADNCTDNTANIAEEAGAIVFSREDSSKRGKGYALEWMFDKIFKLERQYDAVCVFDADNIAHSRFLQEMNTSINEGYGAVQGYIDTKNPNDTWVTAAYAMNFWTLNKLYQSARYNLNLSNQICGTGFAIKTDVLKQYGWGATCLAEDMEFTMKLVLSGMKVGWNYDAIVYDEKPLTLSQSWKQRTRWMQGHSDVASRFVVPLFKKAIAEKNIIPFDNMMYLFQPMILVVSFLCLIISIMQGFYPQMDELFFAPWKEMSGPFWNVMFFSQILYIPAVLYFEKKLTPKILFYYVPYLIFTYTWMPIAVQGILRKNKKDWFHTQHTRKISITEIE